MSIVQRYLAGFAAVATPVQRTKLAITKGARVANLERLLARFPACPEALLELLGKMDGTHYRLYPGGTVVLLVLGSDLGGCPYYLRSVKQILEYANAPHLRDTLHQVYDGAPHISPNPIGPGIHPHVPICDYLCFAECANNGGTSALFLDFNPAPGGTVGQVVRFIHDPDEYRVIAPSFEAYLELLIEADYPFVNDFYDDDNHDGEGEDDDHFD
ncbi:SMI1/KNR4 family protein [Pseudomonas sp. SC11]|uniref:SMI1/KNR4 family protein n=1 Tax=Pseudomonas sp. SC11 TaxID=326927 RepID=UPI00399B5C04